MKVKIYNKYNTILPEYKTSGSAGMDLCATIDKNNPVILPSGHRAVIPTGLYMELPEGYEAQIRPRSGMAIKHGITVINAPGTIDSDYRGEIKVGIVNLDGAEAIINDGDRIAQMVISKYERIEWQKVENEEELSGTKRGTGGFGSTGKK